MIEDYIQQSARCSNCIVTLIKECQGLQVPEMMTPMQTSGLTTQRTKSLLTTIQDSQVRSRNLPKLSRRS